MPKLPDDSERAAAGELPNDPEANTETWPSPNLAPKLGEMLQPAFERMRRRQAGKEHPIPLPAIWPTLAKTLNGGLWPGLHVFVGGTGIGKTQFCLQLAVEAAREGTPVLYVALEAVDIEIVARCLGLIANIQWSDLYHGKRDDLEDLITKYASKLEALPLHIRLAPTHGWPASALTAEVQALRETYPETTPGETPLLVVLDFLQIMGAGDTHDDLRARIGRAAYVIKDVARTGSSVAMLVASSTARDNYATAKRSGKRPAEDDEDTPGQGWPGRLVGHGKESGDIEYACDTVLVLKQEPWKGKTPPTGGTVCHLAVAKLRAGTLDWVPLRFDGRAFTEPGAPTPLPGAPPR